MRRFVALFGVLALVVTGLTVGIGAAQAVPDQSLKANTAPMWQTNGRVWTLVYADGVLYAGGEFTKVRPPGAAAGTQEVVRNRFAAFNAQTGALLPLTHDFNGIVRGIGLSPDENTLYVVGQFTTVNAAARGRGAAINLTTGALTAWNPKLGDTAWAVDATASAVYLGGTFGRANNIVRNRLAAFTPAGALLPWAPNVDAYVRTLKVSPDESRVIFGGGFSFVNGEPMRALGSVDPVSGANEVFNNGIIPTIPGEPVKGGCCYSEAVGLSDDGTYMYVASEGTGGGVFDGSVKFNPLDGTIIWREGCLGATQHVLPLNGAVYKASHAHDCSSVAGGFAQISSPAETKHLMALDQNTGAILHWYPAINGGGGLGPRIFATDGTQLFVGGEFTSVDNKGQQGLTRFSTTGVGTSPKRPLAPSATAKSTGTVTVRWPATWDADDATLKYDLFRNTKTGAPIATLDASSRPYELPQLSIVDSTLPAGVSALYYVRVTDGANVQWSPASNTVVGGQVATTYPGAVTSDGADFYWRLAESSGSTAADATGHGKTGTYTGGSTLGVAGVLAGNAAVHVDGGSGAVASNVSQTGPQSYSVEAWVKTTSNTGGKLVGFGNAQTGMSTNYDRHVYLTNAGVPVFGTYNNGVQIAVGNKRVNDGQWHYIVGTQDSTGMTLFVDGVAVATNPATVAQSYSGYWRVGGDNLGGWPSQPSSAYLAGDVDEVAVYPYAVGADEVALHYDLSDYTLTPPPPPPTDCPGSEFLATYWNNTTLSGDAALVRCESAVDYDWGNGSPADEVGSDGFSVRWTSTQTLAAGGYHFETLSDDGIRLYVDGNLVIDNWTDHGPDHRQRRSCAGRRRPRSRRGVLRERWGRGGEARDHATALMHLR